jgi:hypothetical protein
MLKKRAMSDARWVSELAEKWIDEINVKRLETGYADNQPKWPYWVRPYNYSEPEWLQINVWIIDTMGNNNWLTENARWVGSDRKYWFRDEQDRTMFLLRWS